MDKTFVLEMVRLTEAAALGAASVRGFGDKIEADKRAYENMKNAFSGMPFVARVVGSEGEKDGVYIYRSRWVFSEWFCRIILWGSLILYPSWHSRGWLVSSIS